MQATQAFQRVDQAFAFAIHAYARIAEWKASMDRLAQFEAAMAAVDRPDPAGATIERINAAGPDLAISDLVLAWSAEQPIASVPNVELKPADRLLVGGPSGSGKSTLMRALAGIWPRGRGRIALPHGARVLALPQRPYFPLGTLRQALAYPMLADTVAEAEIRAAMAETGLSHLASGSTNRPTGRRRFPAASSSALAWRARSCIGRRCCCSTRRSRRSKMPRRASSTA
jgi:putative ATP-binding cassette transporter